MFAAGPIPYPKRDFLSDEEQDDKSENKVSVGLVPVIVVIVIVVSVFFWPMPHGLF